MANDKEKLPLLDDLLVAQSFISKRSTTKQPTSGTTVATKKRPTAALEEGGVSTDQGLTSSSRPKTGALIEVNEERRLSTLGKHQPNALQTGSNKAVTVYERPTEERKRQFAEESRFFSRAQRTEVVLDEDDYVDSLQHIISRDYYPELLKAGHSSVSVGATNRQQRMGSNNSSHDNKDDDDDLQVTLTVGVCGKRSSGGNTPRLEPSSLAQLPPDPVPYSATDDDNNDLRRSSRIRNREEKGDETMPSQPKPKRLRRDDLSLTEFTQLYTSEDNASAQKIMDARAEAKKSKYWWLEQQQQRADVVSDKNRLTNQGADGALAIGWGYKALNAVMFHPQEQPSSTTSSTGLVEVSQITPSGTTDKVKGSVDAKGATVMLQVDKDGVTWLSGKNESEEDEYREKARRETMSRTGDADGTGDILGRSKDSRHIRSENTRLPPGFVDSLLPTHVKKNHPRQGTAAIPVPSSSASTRAPGAAGAIAGTETISTSSPPTPIPPPIVTWGTIASTPLLIHGESGLSSNRGRMIPGPQGTSPAFAVTQSSNGSGYVIPKEDEQFMGAHKHAERLKAAKTKKEDYAQLMRMRTPLYTGGLTPTVGGGTVPSGSQRQSHGPSSSTPMLSVAAQRIHNLALQSNPHAQLRQRYQTPLLAHGTTKPDHGK